VLPQPRSISPAHLHTHIYTSQRRKSIRSSDRPRADSSPVVAAAAARRCAWDCRPLIDRALFTRELPDCCRQSSIDARAANVFRSRLSDDAEVESRQPRDVDARTYDVNARDSCVRLSSDDRMRLDGDQVRLKTCRLQNNNARVGLGCLMHAEVAQSVRQTEPQSHKRSRPSRQQMTVA
jgi:hypothetical protein